MISEPHKTEGLEPQKSEDYEETKEKETEEEQSGLRNSKGSRRPAEKAGNKALDTRPAALSTTKNTDVQSGGGRRTNEGTGGGDSRAASRNGAVKKAQGERNRRLAQAHQLANK
ncbi:MAG TPA: hypothetical protein VKT82_06130 [Ktedonobacterales bacterium]|nr:hypothetical protein [Ktedonobacterales bacterium]